MTPLLCDCGSQKAYALCCGRYTWRGRKSLPRTRKRLMRSRYTAFCRKDADYLAATMAPWKNRSGDDLRQELSRIHGRHPVAGAEDP